MEKFNFQQQKIPFTQVANSVLLDTNLSLKAKGLFAYLYSKPIGWDFSHLRMAEELKESKNTILSIIQELEQAGYLLRKRQSNGRVVYQLSFEPHTKNWEEGEKASTQKCHSGKIGDISNKYNNNNIISNNNNISDSNNINKIINTEKVPFDSFWSIYPKKRGSKKLAESKWNKLPKQVQENIIKNVTARKEKDVQWLKDNGQFIPHPSTFLNQDRYLEEWTSKENITRTISL